MIVRPMQEEFEIYDGPVVRLASLKKMCEHQQLDKYFHQIIEETLKEDSKPRDKQLYGSN